jgi:hypothetical protein
MWSRPWRCCLRQENVIHLNENSGVFKGIGSISKLIEEFENGGTELREVELTKL